MTDDLPTTIKRIFSSIQKLPIEDVDMHADIFDHYGVDSLRAVKLLSTLEVELDLELPIEDLQDVRTLQEVVALCASTLRTV